MKLIFLLEEFVGCLHNIPTQKKQQRYIPGINTQGMLSSVIFR